MLQIEPFPPPQPVAGVMGDRAGGGANSSAARQNLMTRNARTSITFRSSRGAPPSCCRHLPSQAGEGFQTDISSFSFPCEAGEGAEGGWGQSWLSLRSSFRIKLCNPLLRPRHLAHQRPGELHLVGKHADANALVATMRAAVVEVVEHGIDAVARNARAAQIQAVRCARRH